MVKIGLLSDTHSYLDDAVFTYFEACDEIWHAGDVGDATIIKQLQNFKRTRGVYGNIDDAKVKHEFPEHQKFTIEQVPVWMTHIGGYPPKYHPNVKPEIFQHPPKIFISGHSHILKVMYDPKIACLHLNPGAAGNVGWHQVRTLLRFDISEDRIENLQIIELGKRSKL